MARRQTLSRDVLKKRHDQKAEALRDAKKTISQLKRKLDVRETDMREINRQNVRLSAVNDAYRRRHNSLEVSAEDIGKKLRYMDRSKGELQEVLAAEQGRSKDRLEALKHVKGVLRKERRRFKEETKLRDAGEKGLHDEIKRLEKMPEQLRLDNAFQDATRAARVKEVALQQELAEMRVQAEAYQATIEKLKAKNLRLEDAAQSRRRAQYFQNGSHSGEHSIA